MPSPHVGVQVLGVPLQLYPDSVRQSVEQPSPPAWFPSSHVSPAAAFVVPLPHSARTEEDEEDEATEDEEEDDTPAEDAEDAATEDEETDDTEEEEEEEDDEEDEEFVTS